MDNINYLLPGLVLGVVFAPLLGALLSLFTKGRTAVPFAALHLGLIVGLLVLVYGPLDERGRMIFDRESRTTAESTFVPLGVPGDPGFATASENATGTTAWGLLSLGATQSSVPTPEIQLYLGVDGLNIWLLALSGLMTLIALLISQGQIRERFGAYAAWLFVLQTAALGAFTAFDVILFYIFFELTLIPSFFLIGQWGVGRSRRDAARLFFIYTLFGSLFTLIGLLGIVLTNPTPINPNGYPNVVMYQINKNKQGELVVPSAGPITFSIPALIRNVSAWSWASRLKLDEAQITLEILNEKAEELAASLPNQPAERANTIKQELANLADQVKEQELKLAEAKSEREQRTLIQTLLFIALVAGFAVKIPIVPFHTWLPTAYAEAPLPVTMLFSAVLAKLGTYGVLRVVLPLAPDAFVSYGTEVFGTLGAIGIIYAAFCAFAQKDIKLLTAYSSISHLGFLVIALFVANSESISGALLHMVNHGLSTGVMFALLGFLYVRYRTLDMNLYGGLLGKFPGFSFLFIVACLASVGLPGLNNFVSEMLMLASLFNPGTVKVLGFGLAVAAASGIFLSAWYTFSMVRHVFFGTERTPNVAEATIEGPANLGMTAPERLGFILPLLLCLVLGLYPQPILDTMSGDVEVLVQHADVARIRNDLATTSELYNATEEKFRVDQEILEPMRRAPER